MSLIPIETPRFEEMNSVVELYIQNLNETQISKRLGIKRKDVLSHLDTWRNAARGSEVMQQRVDELLTIMDGHYGKLIRKFYEIVEYVDGTDRPTPAMLAQKGSALKSIAELEAKRLDILQKSGFMDGDILGDKIAHMETEREVLLDILHEELCKTCKAKVFSRYSEYAKGNVVLLVE